MKKSVNTISLFFKIGVVIALIGGIIGILLGMKDRLSGKQHYITLIEKK